MQVYLQGGTPLLAYSPCRDCPPNQGWASNADFEGDNTTIATGGDSTRTKGTDPGFVTSAPNATVGLNFTGTGVLFDIAYAPAAGAVGPGAGAGTSGSDPDWTTTLLVNGSAPPATATAMPYGVVGLPLGRHEFSLQLSRNSGTGTGNETWARIEGVHGTLGGLISAGTTNTTIDDSAWANGSIALSPHWNMLESGKSNYINETQFQIELNNADRHFNRSISWTTTPGAQNTILFEGSAVWVFGLSGGEAGTFEVKLDNVSQGVFNAAGGPRTYNQTLWHISGIADGPHTVQLINQAGRLSFDRLVATRGIVDATMGNITHPTTKLGTQTPSGTSTAAISSAAAEAAGKEKTPTAVVVGASVGSVVGLLIMTLAAFFIWSRCRRRNKAPKHTWQEPRPWYSKFGRDKGWNFVSLDEPHRQMAQHGGVWDRVSRSDTFKSSSSFGSSASHLRQPAPAHTRRSLLPLANNLWAKTRKTSTDEYPHPMTEVGPTLKPPSPDPMALALGGSASPLTQLQRNFSSSSRDAPDHRPLVQGKEGGAVGTREWYDWFGLSTYSERLSLKSGRTDRSGRSGRSGGGGGAPRAPPNARVHEPMDGSSGFGLRQRPEEYALEEPRYTYNDMTPPKKRYM